MGDRTTVYLTVLLSQADAAEQLFTATADRDYEGEMETTQTYCFYECNYGTLGFENKLIEAGIAYDKRWETGDNYGAGDEYFRFEPTGETRIVEIYDDARGVPLDKLKALIDDTEKLKEYILQFEKDHTALPLDEKQIEYGKLYQMKKLITS